MGWVWRDDDGDDANNSSEGGRCTTRTVVRSQCRTEEVEPGKFIRKCEKNEEILRDCIGKPVEVIKSNREYTEDDVTKQVIKGSYPSGSFDAPFNFPGLRSDIESIESQLFGGINQFFEAAEEMKNSFLDAFGYDQQSSSSPSMRQGVPIEGKPEMEASPKLNRPDSNPEHFDLSGLAKDV